MTKRRIAIAGFQHETNSFAPTCADWAAFEMADSWPGLLTGEAVVTGTHGMNLPIAGAIRAAMAAEIEIVPILWCAAEPSGLVTDHAFDRISNMIRAGVQQAGPIDAVYLDLHGAMVTQTHDDGEAALLALLRAEVGPDMPIVISLDLHANMSAALVDATDIITIYRTYPHLDMAETGQRAIAQLVRRWDRGTPLVSAFRPVPFLIPLHAQYTGAAPCRDLYDMLSAWSDHPAEYAELALGFTASDIADCGPSIIAYAGDTDRANALADQMLAAICDAASDFETSMLPPDKAVAAALTHDGVTVLADVQDNPGAGGSSDTTGLLHALIAAGANATVMGVLCDPDIAATAHRMGVGATFTGTLGGASASCVGGAGGTGADRLPPPVVARFTVVTLSDGNIAYTGEMYGGGVATLGPSCVLGVTANDSDIQIVVSTNRIQCLDQALFTAMGIELASARLICVKSTVHYRADFGPISDHVITVASPGLFPCDLPKIAYQKTTRRVL